MIRLEPEEAILFLDSRTSDEVVLNDPPKMVHRSTQVRKKQKDKE